MVLESNMVSHLCVTMEASDPAESERSTVFLTQSGSSVNKRSPRRSNGNACVTRGALHRITLALSLHAISKAGRDFSFVGGSRVFYISGSSSGRWRACIVKRLAGPNVLPGFSSWQALPVRPVVLGAQCRSGMVWQALWECMVPAASVSSGGRP